MPQRLAAVRNVISWLRKRRTTSPKQGGRSSFGRPNFTPRAFAAASPCFANTASRFSVITTTRHDLPSRISRERAANVG